MNTIIPGQTLTSRSIGDHECIYTLRILSRTANRATFEQDGKVAVTKIHANEEGEFLMPKRYSMAPIYSAISASQNVIPFPVAA